MLGEIIEVQRQNSVTVSDIIVRGMHKKLPGSDNIRQVVCNLCIFLDCLVNYITVEEAAAPALL